MKGRVCIILSKDVQKGTWILSTEMGFFAAISPTRFHDSFDQQLPGLSTRFLIVKKMNRVTANCSCIVLIFSKRTSISLI